MKTWILMFLETTNGSHVTLNALEESQRLSILRLVLVSTVWHLRKLEKVRKLPRKVMGQKTQIFLLL
jgi:hypothetical protein